MEKLNSKSLMIGDWVLYDGKPNIITEVSEIIYGEATVCFVGNNYMANMDEIEPIPLTETMLIKHFPDTGIFTWRPVDYPDKAFVIDYTEEGIDGVDIHISVKFVHELQHLLHLLGIGKEIEL